MWTRLRRHRRWVIAAAAVAAALLFFMPPFGSYVHEHHIDQRLDRLMPRIERHAREQGLDPLLVRAVVRAESGGRPEAVSPKNAKGLMQVTDIAHRDVMQRFGLPGGNLFDPDYNLRVGTTYLRYLLDRFEGDVVLALTAYHMGPSAVNDRLRKHPELTPEALLDHHAGPATRRYVRTVLASLVVE